MTILVCPGLGANQRGRVSRLAGQVLLGRSTCAGTASIRGFESVLRQGFTSGDIGKVGGGNYCRAFGKVTAGNAKAVRNQGT
jgi:hypothetical protein